MTWPPYPTITESVPEEQASRDAFARQFLLDELGLAVDPQDSQAVVQALQVLDAKRHGNRTDAGMEPAVRSEPVDIHFSLEPQRDFYRDLAVQVASNLHRGQAVNIESIQNRLKAQNLDPDAATDIMARAITIFRTASQDLQGVTDPNRIQDILTSAEVSEQYQSKTQDALEQQVQQTHDHHSSKPPTDEDLVVEGNSSSTNAPEGFDGNLGTNPLDDLKEDTQSSGKHAGNKEQEATGPRSVTVNGFEYQIPYGFSSGDDFVTFCNRLREGLPEGVEPIFQGSSVTGRKAITSKGIKAGTPFDVGRTSDFDIGLISEDLITIAAVTDLMKIKTGPTRIGPVKADSPIAEVLGLNELLVELSAMEKRKVEFNLYDSLEEAMKAQQSLIVP